MRYWYLRLAVFLGALAVPAWWLYQAWIFALGPDPGKTLVDRL
ncbi:sulfoxide reductase heme-binding subunit YedZ, partial [Pseudomonas aeruginosa]